MMKKRVVAGIAVLTCLALHARLVACEPENKPISPVNQTLPLDNSQLMLGAVMNSETEEVRRLAERHQGLDERDTGDQSTPMIAASDTDQWPVVEILIDHGADIWAHDRFGITTAQRTLTSRILRGSPEGAARLRVIEKLKARGYPFPPPSRAKILALDKAGKWPPSGVKR
ncbi:hypothetical protein ACLEIY_17375 [Acetobacter tropicalis]|uniref:hypothetical protein n=1 Tax=Acetobacter tropicalis TaxID=104102 RepID=UPI0039749652